MIVGDEHARVTEAAKAAERHLRCKVLRTSPFWSKDGFSKDTYNEQVWDLTLGFRVRSVCWELKGR